MVWLVALIGAWSAHAQGGERAAAPVNVVLVHGIFNRGRMFDPLVRALETAGCRCYAPSLLPNDGTTGIHDLAAKLSAGIDARFGPRAPFFLIGFSMGGIVSRDYVENTPGRRRVRGLFLIATPSHGTLWAGLASNAHLRELAPGSSFLRALNADDTAWRTVPVHAYWTPLDLMVFPSVNARWPEGKTTRVLCPLHPWMVRDHAVIADLVARLTVAPLPPPRFGPPTVPGKPPDF